MRIEEYEFEEEKTLDNLADLLVEIAEQIRSGEKLELPMGTVKSRIHLGKKKIKQVYFA